MASNRLEKWIQSAKNAFLISDYILLYVNGEMRQG